MAAWIAASRRGGAADDLDQRHEMGRVERVADEDPLGVTCTRRCRSVGIRPEELDAITTSGGGDRVDLAVQLVLDVEAFRRVLLDEVGTVDGLGGATPRRDEVG